MAVGAEPHPTGTAPSERADQPPTRSLVAAVTELRWVGRSLCLIGAGGLVGGMVTGEAREFTPLEQFGSVFVFVLTAASAVAGSLLGRRSGPAVMYARAFERAPSPPAWARPEPPWRTAARAVLASAALALVLVIVAGVGLAAALLLMGKPRNEVLIHLPAAAELVGTGWALLAGAAALRIAHWFARWQRPRRKVVLCRPLLSGVMRPIYYVADALPPP